MKRSEIREEIVEAMVTSILAELVSNHTDLDPLDIGLETDDLVRALKEEGVEAGEQELYWAWSDAYDNVVHGDGEYWRDEYGMDYEEVGFIVDRNADKIEKRVLSLLK